MKGPGDIITACQDGYPHPHNQEIQNKNGNYVDLTTTLSYDSIHGSINIPELTKRVALYIHGIALPKG